MGGSAIFAENISVTRLLESIAAEAGLTLADPRASLVRRISVETLAEVGTISVEGTPYNITVARGSGVTH